MSTDGPVPGRWDLPRTRVIGVGVGAAALALCLLGALLLGDWPQFFRSYLVAFQFCLGIALGCLVIVMLYQLTGGAWGYLIRRILEAGMRTLPLLIVLAVPLALGLRFIYPWVDRPPERADKAFYLGVPFFLGRAALYLVAWTVLALVFDRWSAEHDRSDDPAQPRKFRLLAAPGLVVYGVLVTFAGIDWLMSLQPDWYSTIFSVLYAVGQILSGMAFAIVMLVLLRDRPPLARALSPEVLIDLGNLLLTFIILWTYMSFSQFMLIWVGNLPEEIVWYLPRTRGGWKAVAWSLAVFHFLVPFFLLLSRDIKRNPVALGWIAGGVLFMQLVQLNWQVLPASRAPSLGDHWMAFLAPLGLGGLWLAYFLWQLERRPLLPRHDPSAPEAARLHEEGLRREAVRPEATHHG